MVEECGGFFSCYWQSKNTYIFSPILLWSRVSQPRYYRNFGLDSSLRKRLVLCLINVQQHPGLYLLDASSTISPSSCEIQNYLQTLKNVPGRMGMAKVIAVETHYSRDSWWDCPLCQVCPISFLQRSKEVYKESYHPLDLLPDDVYLIFL